MAKTVNTAAGHAVLHSINNSSRYYHSSGTSSRPTVLLPHLCRYHAASTAASQALYQEMARPVIDQVCKGFNGTILAYGQTGARLTA